MVFSLALVFTVLYGFFHEASSQTTSPSDALISTGIAQIVEGDVVRAQNEAIADAQKKALLQAVGMLMTFDLLEDRFASLKDTLFEQTTQYLQSYRVLYENTVGDYYRITLQSTIAFKELEEYLVNLQVLSPKVKLPRILLMIAQQKLKQNFSTCWWSFIDPERELTTTDQIIRNKLQKNGFEVLDHIQLLPSTPIKKVYGCLEVKPEAIKTLGAQFKADIALVGTIQTELRNEDGPKKSVQANLTANALNIGSGAVVATLDTFIPATEDDEATAERIALEKAANLFADQIGEQIASRWVKEYQGINLITLRVLGLSTYLDFSQLKSSLKKGIPEINTLFQKTLSEKEALFEAESSLTSSSLADVIKSKSLEGFTVSVKKVSPDMIELQATPHATSTGEKQTTTTTARKGTHE